MNSRQELYKIDGPALLLAGPGTGKTHTLAQRIRYLVEDKGVAPFNITVITFTAAAAKNMRERISDPNRPILFVKDEKQPKLICTMHSLGFKIIRENTSLLSLSDNISIVYSDRLRNTIMGDAAQIAGYHRDDGYDASLCRQYGNCTESDDKKCKICKYYQKILRECNAIDYDDQILLAYKILESNHQVLEKYQEQCVHLLVDEYQDINRGQFKLIKILSQDNPKGLFTVGDDDQSIYSWRGGSPDFIRNFHKYFGFDATIVQPNISYRCLENILKGALTILDRYDNNRLPKDNFIFNRDSDTKIKIHNMPSDRKEAKEIAKIASGSLPTQSVLVLLPHRGYADIIIQELKKARIPFIAPPALPGEGLPLLKVLFSWLEDNTDNLSFRECVEAFLNSKSSGIPSRRVRKKEKKDEREEAYRIVSVLWQNIFTSAEKSLFNSLSIIKNQNEIYSKIYDSFQQIKELWDTDIDVEKFIIKAIQILSPWETKKQLLKEIKYWIESIISIETTSSDSNVRLMTFQGSKGLESKVVCIVGLEEKTLPRSDNDPEKLAEESRLMFVSMTRASDELHIFHARRRSADVLFRNIYQKEKSPDLSKSRFLDVIPKKNKTVMYHNK